MQGTYKQTAGTTDVAAGGLLKATDVELEGGVLKGFGTIQANLNNTGGIVGPGDPGTMTIEGDFTNGPLGLIELYFSSATDYDKIAIKGKADLGGTLKLIFLKGYDPVLGTRFDLFSALGAGSNFRFDTITDNTGKVFAARTLVSGGQFNFQLIAVPEPATVMAGIAALALVALHQRRLFAQRRER